MKPQAANSVKRLQQLGVDIENGVIPLIGEVDSSMYSFLIDSLTALSNAGLEYEMLTVLLNTYGGEVYYAFAIYDLLKSQSMPIRIVCNGPVMSAGTIILMAGEVREMTPLSYLMVHYGVDVNDSHSSLKHNTHLLSMIKKLYKDNTNATAKAIGKWFNADTYFSAEKALEIGFVHKVIDYAKKETKKSTTRTRK